MTTRSLRFLCIFFAFFLVAAACGSDDADDAAAPVATGEEPAPDSAGACLEGEPDCQDTLTPLPGEEPIDLDPDTGEPVGDGSLRVDQVVGTDIDGGFAISGFVFDDGSGLRLCEVLACSGPSRA